MAPLEKAQHCKVCIKQIASGFSLIMGDVNRGKRIILKWEHDPEGKKRMEKKSVQLYNTYLVHI